MDLLSKIASRKLLKVEGGTTKEVVGVGDACVDLLRHSNQLKDWAFEAQKNNWTIPADGSEIRRENQLRDR